MRLLWGLLFLLALAVSPLIALALVALLIIIFRPFHRKEYGRPSVTLRGEVVRSGAEKAIADWFTRNGIRYLYEYSAINRRGLVISKPDFYLPDYGVYVEYWGLAGANRQYDRRMNWKTAEYRRNRIRCISLYPDDLPNLDTALGGKLQTTRMSFVEAHCD